MSNISTRYHKSTKALVLENEWLAVSILPEIGSKIVSILYKPLNHELLWQEPDEDLPQIGYATPYGKAESIGFDEMFPTVSRCFCEDEPWLGAEIPDHGEVRTLPWDYELEDRCVKLRIHGGRFPYLLEKTVRLDEACVKIDYCATNLSPFDFQYIWAAHPLFTAVPDMEIVVPQGMNSIINSVAGATLQSYGKQYDFPLAMLDNGEQCSLEKISEKDGVGYQKYYFAGKVPEGWCALYNPEKQLNVGLSFPKEQIPYLGMWVNEGGWGEQYVVAPEPASGAMDRVDFARQWGMNSVLTAHSQVSWFLNIFCREGKKLVSPDSIYCNKSQNMPSRTRPAL
ncbi:MAG: hypothetical protein GY801_43720 [bacterium]|nr:hypothetical protein [bacterium]